MRTMFLLLYLAALLVSGCAKSVLVGSFCGPLPEHSAVSAIAADAVTCLSTLYPPGKTSLHLLPAMDADNDFATTFENGLRGRGFTLAAVESDKAITVAYVFDSLGDTDQKAAWYLHLSLFDPKSGNKSIARAYTTSGHPEAGQSHRDFKFSSHAIHATERNP